MRCREVLLPKLRAQPRRLVAGPLSLHPFELRQAHFQARMGSMIVVKSPPALTDRQTHAVKHSMFHGGEHCSSAFKIRKRQPIQPRITAVSSDSHSALEASNAVLILKRSCGYSCLSYTAVMSSDVSCGSADLTVIVMVLPSGATTRRAVIISLPACLRLASAV